MNKKVKRIWASFMMLVMLLPVMPTAIAASEWSGDFKVEARTKKDNTAGTRVKLELSVADRDIEPSFTVTEIKGPEGEWYDSIQYDKFDQQTSSDGYNYYTLWNIVDTDLKGTYTFYVNVKDENSNRQSNVEVDYDYGGTSSSTDDGAIRKINIDYRESRDYALIDMDVYTSSNTRFDEGEFTIYDPDNKTVSSSYIKYTNNRKTSIELDTSKLDYGKYTVRAETYNTSGSRMDRKEETFTIGSNKASITKMKAINDKTGKENYDIGDSIRVEAKTSGDDIYRVNYEFLVNGRVVEDGETRGRTTEPYAVWDTSRVGKMYSTDKVEVSFIAKDRNGKELTYESLLLEFFVDNVSVKIKSMSPQYYNSPNVVIPIRAEVTGTYFTETKFTLHNDTFNVDVPLGNQFTSYDNESAFPKADIRLPLSGSNVQGVYTVTATTYYKEKEVSKDTFTFSILNPVTQVQDDDPLVNRGPGVHVIVNGKLVVFADQGPAIVDERTLVPVRGVFEKMGFVIDWDKSGTATLEDADNIIQITANDDKMYVNGEAIALEVPARIMNERMMLPLRAISESVGAKVQWYQTTGTATIDYNRY